VVLFKGKSRGRQGGNPARGGDQISDAKSPMSASTERESSSSFAPHPVALASRASKKKNCRTTAADREKRREKKTTIVINYPSTNRTKNRGGAKPTSLLCVLAHKEKKEGGAYSTQEKKAGGLLVDHQEEKGELDFLSCLRAEKKKKKSIEVKEVTTAEKE